MPGRYAFCYYVRGYLPGVYSNQSVAKDFVYNNGLVTDENEIFEKAKDADVIVMQRPTEDKHVQVAAKLKRIGKKIIFENDDTYKAEEMPLDRMNSEKASDLFKKMSANVKKILSFADGVIASTEFLADEYRQVNKNVVVLKNCIDPLDEYECKPNTTGKFRIGFIGSVTSNDDYTHIKDQIRKLDQRDDVTIVVMGVKYRNGSYFETMKDDYDFWSSLKNVEWHPYVPTPEYMMTVASLALDLAIIPREESYFNKCKSNLKYLEMSLLKIPVLAQGFSDGKSPYQIGCEHLTIVNDNSTWHDKILEIKDNYQVYKDMAEKAHDFVLKEYNIKTYAQEWTKAIEKLCKT